MKGKEKISTVFYVTDPAQFESQFMSNLGEEEVRFLERYV